MELHTLKTLLKTNKSVLNLLKEDITLHGVSFTEFAVLEALLQKRPLGVNEVLDKVLVNSSTLSYTITKLKESGYIEEAKEGDKRCKILSLTPSGDKLISKVATKHYTFIKSLQGLTSEEEETLVKLLNKIRKGN